MILPSVGSASTAGPASCSSRSECLWQSCLLQHAIGSVTRFDLVVDRKAAFGQRAVPDLMVALSWAVETAARLLEQGAQLRAIVRHQAA